jgi:outer membrane PBP1 activator LpoA protein
VYVPGPALPYSAFEEDRRSVDKNSAGYLQNRGGNAASAEQHYLNARALIQEKKYGEAVLALQKAREALNTASEDNRTTLELEIATAMAIAQSKEAQTVFEKERLPNAANSNTNVNSNNPAR